MLSKTIVDSYNDVMSKGDPRVDNWLLMSSPVPTILLTCLYISFVKLIGPKLMERRNPFQLKKVMIAYNAFQTAFSAWMFYKAGVNGWFTDYNLRCQPVDYSTSPSAMGMLHVHWWFFFSKFTEFTDTVFFILRKKNNQVTNLHIIHHAIVPILVWFSAKFVGTGHYTIVGLLNTFVHVIMYGYYMLAAMGPGVKKYLWWKRYLTTLQLTQFAIVIVHSAQIMFFKCEGVPKIFVAVVLFQGFLFYFLFMNFYQKSYKPEDVKEKKTIPPVTKSRVQDTESVQVSFKQFVMKQLFGMCIPDQTCLHDYPTSTKAHQNGTTNSHSETLKHRVQS